jgi:hypothetical protein
MDVVPAAPAVHEDIESQPLTQVSAQGDVDFVDAESYMRAHASQNGGVQASAPSSQQGFQAHDSDFDSSSDSDSDSGSESDSESSSSDSEDEKAPVTSGAPAVLMTATKPPSALTVSPPYPCVQAVLFSHSH